jgi:hypothetical protein
MIVIDLIVSTRNRFFSSVYKTFLIENTLSTDALVPETAY